ncbi:SulA-like leucine-rich domain-containing protein [Vibrio metschnikovii]|uniref:Superfamily II DNA and RNA helicase n=1 Tax=Vibrio metschnikovii TaxID=28172 RepID=A0A9X0R7U1_VIBME|nr:SulA-like leucine-rich domain-containing protein [Vibrio metschnikovii]MBC5850046.1 hypothetical protein [Vibrio metschnikovii]
MLNTTFHYSDAIYDSCSVNRHCVPQLNHPILSRLAQLSEQRQWILYTAQCPRPHYQQLSMHRIQCHKIIHMKASRSGSEIDIVLKAIQSGNASAIVASAGIDKANQRRLQHMAKQHQCEVFFLNKTSPVFH